MKAKQKAPAKSIRKIQKEGEALLVCEHCAVDEVDEPSVQTRDCGHVLCEECSVPCLECEMETE